MWRFLFGSRAAKADAEAAARRARSACATGRDAEILTADLVDGIAPGGFLVACEIRAAANHARVAALMERSGAKRLLASLWLVETDGAILALRDQVRAALGDDDAVAVVELQPGAWWACENADHEGLEWLREKVLA